MPLFTNGIIGDLRLLACLDYCRLGNQYLLRQPINGFTLVKSYPLKGMELQRSSERFQNRRKNMNTELLKIQRTPIVGEKYIDDYQAGGDYVEV